VWCLLHPGRRFFDELDRDGDGRVTLADVKAALRKRNLPDSYATDLMNRVRRNRWWLSSFG
jgi:Ca2+-binding EF-hand superfamily protein